MTTIIAIVAAALLGWAVCSVFAGGLYFAYFQREWPDLAEQDYASDRRKAKFWACFGPIALVVLLFMSGVKHGLKFR